MKALALACAAALCGCIAVPLPPHDPSEPTVRWLAESASGASRAELLLRLGEPDVVGDDARVLVYLWHDPRLFVVIGGYGSAAAFTVAKEYDVVLALDEGGHLVHYELATGYELAPDAGSDCTRDGLCVEGQSGLPPLPLRFAARAESRTHVLYSRAASPEARDVPSGACLVQVFPVSAWPDSVWLDGALIGFAARGGWIEATAAPGDHAVAALAPNLDPNVPEYASTLSFSCAAGERVVIARSATGALGLVAGPLERRAQTPHAPKGGWRRYLNVAAEAK